MLTIQIWSCNKPVSQPSKPHKWAALLCGWTCCDFIPYIVLSKVYQLFLCIVGCHSMVVARMLFTTGKKCRKPCLFMIWLKETILFNYCIARWSLKGLWLWLNINDVKLLIWSWFVNWNNYIVCNRCHQSTYLAVLCMHAGL